MIFGLYSVCLCILDLDHVVISSLLPTLTLNELMILKKGSMSLCVCMQACVLLRCTALVKTEILNWAACSHITACTLFPLLCFSSSLLCFPYVSLSFSLPSLAAALL